LVPEVFGKLLHALELLGQIFRQRSVCRLIDIGAIDCASCAKSSASLLKLGKIDFLRSRPEPAVPTTTGDSLPQVQLGAHPGLLRTQRNRKES
jgi:hypothetical protein